MHAIIFITALPLACAGAGVNLIIRRKVLPVPRAAVPGVLAVAVSSLACQIVDLPRIPGPPPSTYMAVRSVQLRPTLNSGPR